jgi:hypothetical protein
VTLTTGQANLQDGQHIVHLAEFGRNYGKDWKNPIFGRFTNLDLGTPAENRGLKNYKIGFF